MLPNLGALSLVRAGGLDGTLTEEEYQEMEEEVGPEYAEMYAEMQEDQAKRRAAVVRKDTFDNEDLAKEVMVSLDQGKGSWEVCQLVAKYCSLNKARRDACKDHVWDEVGARIWGKAAQEKLRAWTPQARFKSMCRLERSLRRGQYVDHAWWDLAKDVKRFVLARISGSGRTDDDFHALSFASPRLQDDEEVVRAAVRKDPRAIRHASPRLQALVETFLKPTDEWPVQNPTAFQKEFGPIMMLIFLKQSMTIGTNALWGMVAEEHPEPPDPMPSEDEILDLMWRINRHLVAQYTTGQLGAQYTTGN